VITFNVEIVTTFGFNWIPKVNDLVMLQIGTKMSDAKLTKINKDLYTFTFTKPICITSNQHIIICYNINKILKIVGEGYYT
jgi:translation initiation factor 2 gamma subunit (eIF-2gamma)